MKIEDFIILIKSSEVNAHFYHWNTITYSTHKALEDYYTSIRELVDKLVETAQGKFGMRYNLVGKMITASDLSVENYFGQLSHQSQIMVDVLFRDYKDLENIAIEIVEEINKLRYLLTLQ